MCILASETLEWKQKKSPNISWSASVSNVDACRLSFIFTQKKGKRHKTRACITVYKDPGRAGRLDSLVCLSFLFLLEEKPADSLVPNLISFSSNLKTPDNVLAPTLHLLLLLFFIVVMYKQKVVLGWPVVAMVIRLYERGRPFERQPDVSPPSASFYLHFRVQ